MHTVELLNEDLFVLGSVNLATFLGLRGLDDGFRLGRWFRGSSDLRFGGRLSFRDGLGFGDGLRSDCVRVRYTSVMFVHAGHSLQSKRNGDRPIHRHNSKRMGENIPAGGGGAAAPGAPCSFFLNCGRVLDPCVLGFSYSLYCLRPCTQATQNVCPKRTHTNVRVTILKTKLSR